MLRGAGATAGRASRSTAPTRSARRAPRRPGIAYVPRERRAEALFETLSIRDNFAVPTVARRRRLIRRRAPSAGRLREYVDRLAIRLADTCNPITTLSGGNQQKVVMARWLAAKPRMLVLNDPTRGVDLGAKRDLYALLGSWPSRASRSSCSPPKSMSTSS